ncbi:hypothetical protein [Pseudoalteromonas ardens]|uniref:EF-hand domain-containing protein n=1 Tax=Pseudoalteromonas rubra TaxID=43658 RepID=A0A0L0EYL0_9GAMM|nr:hypothetical protein [Pseudoalteromonas sp. R96]KNC68923.1 hypothetical protein AC626_02040 [Pseudoalteromonas rubra]MDK1310246.1 hypothetical protein [Pseudoalteromonas sp. R96]
MHNFITGLLMAAGLSLNSVAHAHLMVAEQGTLNFDESGAYLVVAIDPLSFPKADTDKNGHLSVEEFKQAHNTLFKAIQAQVFMTQGETQKHIEGLMLSPQTAHHGDEKEIDQIVVMGKFVGVDHQQGLQFHNGLYGKNNEKQLAMRAKYKRLGLTQRFTLTAKQPTAKVF